MGVDKLDAELTHLIGRNRERGELLRTLADAWQRWPDLRLGQLIDTSLYFNEEGDLDSENKPPVRTAQDKEVLRGLRGLVAKYDKENL